MRTFRSTTIPSSLMPVCKIPSRLSWQPWHLSGARTAGPTAGLRRTSTRTADGLAKPALGRPSTVPAARQPAPVPRCPRSRRAYGHTLASPFAASLGTVPPPRANDSPPSCTERHETTPRPACGGEQRQTRVPPTPASPGAAVRGGPSRTATDRRRPARATRPAAVPSPGPHPRGPGDRDARASAPLPERRSPRPWPSAARSRPGSRHHTQARRLSALSGRREAASRGSL